MTLRAVVLWFVAFWLAVAVMLALTVRAASAAPNLSAVASAVAGKPVTVTVEPRDSGDSGTAFVGGNQIWLSPEAYRDATRGDGVGMLTFLHEAGHVTGIVAEDEANGFAFTHMRPLLRQVWRFTPRRALRAYRDARAYQRYEAPAYWWLP